MLPQHCSELFGDRVYWINVWVSHHMKPCLEHVSWLHDPEGGTMYAVTCARVTGTWHLHICSASLTIFRVSEHFIILNERCSGSTCHRLITPQGVVTQIHRICGHQDTIAGHQDMCWTLFELFSVQSPRFGSSAGMFSTYEHLFEPLRYMVQGAWYQAPGGWHQCWYVPCR